MPPVTERTLPVNGIDLHLAEAGPEDGPPVVLLHGFPDSWKLWRHQVDALAAAGLAWRVAMHAPDRVERLAVVSVGHPLAGVAAGLPQRRLSWYVLWFLFPGVAEQVLPADDWALYRRWIWSGTQPGQDPDLDRQLADLSRPGALEAGLNWYRANNNPALFPADDPTRFPLPPVACPTMGVWSSADPTLSEAQMVASVDYVTGPWRYERLDGIDHWVPVHAPDQLNRLLLEFLGIT